MRKLLLLFFILLSTNSYCLYDGFEDGDYNTNPVWTKIDGTGQQVVNTVAAYGNYSVELHSIERLQYTQTTSLTETDVNYHYYSYVRISDKTKTASYVVKRKNQMYGGLQINNGSFEYITTDGYYAPIAGMAETNKWYMFDMLYRPDTNKLTYSVYSYVGSDLNLISKTTITPYNAIGDNNIYIAGNTTAWYDNVVYEPYIIYDFNFNTPTKNEKINTKTYDINFLIFSKDSSKLNLQFFLSESPGLYTQAISQDMNVLDYLNIPNLNCSGDFVTGSFCIYQWDINQNYDKDINFYLDANVNTTTTNTKFSSDNFYFNLIDVNITYPISSFSNINKIDYKVSGICSSYDVNIYVQGILSTQTTIANDVLKSYSFSPAGSPPYRVDVNASCFDGLLFKDSETRIYFLDVTAPTIVSYGLDVNRGFNLPGSNVSAYLKCSDNNSTNIRYILSIDGNSYVDSWFTNGYLYETNISGIYGTPTILATCIDEAVNTTTASKTQTISVLNFRIIDEKTGADFNMNSVENLKIYDMDYNSYYNIKTSGNVYFSYTSGTDDLLRLEFEYDNEGTQTFVNKHFQTGVLAKDTNIFLCGFELQPYYEMIFSSGTEREILMKNIFTSCYTLAAYTDIAYKDTLMNRTYTIDQLYELWTFDSDSKRINLGTIDGTQAEEISIDVLIFKKRKYDTSITQEGLGISREDENTFRISYYNQKNDNISVLVQIYDGTNMIYQSTQDTNANNFLIFFNYSTITIENNLIKIELTLTKSDNTTEIITSYFDKSGNVGALDPAIAIIISLFLVFFGLTIVASRFSLGWFGILIILISLFITTLAIPVWYIRFFQVVLIICLVFVLLIFKGETGRYI